MKKWLILVAYISLAPCSHAYEQMPEAKPDPYQGLKEFNGMTLKQFGDFTKWNLVTVRYRRDSNEMRFTYANPLAWKGLQSGTKSYPDGAIFAKIGVKTSEDPAFTSSVVPEGSARFQFMVKNGAKFKDTDGWGYAIFDENGKTFAGEPKATTVACHACHRLVPERDFVFSKPANLSAFLKGRKNQASQDGQQIAEMKWKILKRAELTEEIAKIVPTDFEQVHAVTGALQKHFFIGTLDEIRPALIRRATETKSPAILISDDRLTYSLIYPGTNKGPECKSGQTQFVHVLKTSTTVSQPRIKMLCQ